jgi:hypothetical protein
MIGKIHLRRPRESGRAAYCGEMCFGMGSSATYDRGETTCHMCLTMLQLSEQEKLGPLDKFVLGVNRDPPVT